MEKETYVPRLPFKMEELNGETRELFQKKEKMKSCLFMWSSDQPVMVMSTFWKYFFYELAETRCEKVSPVGFRFFRLTVPEI